MRGPADLMTELDDLPQRTAERIPAPPPTVRHRALLAEPLSVPRSPRRIGLDSSRLQPAPALRACRARAAWVVMTLLLALTDPAGLRPASAEPLEPRPLTVRVQLSRGPHYVGQSLVLQVSSVAGAERPSVPAPRVAGAEVQPIGTDLKPTSTSGIGGVRTEQNLFIARFRVLPRRAGVLTIPAIPVRLGDRSGASQPLRLNVRDVPLSGRTAAFLGGVGPFDITAEASAATIRLGQPLEYRLRVTGPAARSMNRVPELGLAGKGTAGPKVEPLPPEAVDDPPSRLFRYRIRPSQAGPLVVPPVAIAAFDPGVGRYLTKVSPSVTVRVIETQRFDPRTLDYRIPSAAEAVWPRVLAAAGVAAASAAAGIAIWRRTSQRRTRRRSDRAVRKLLARLAQGPTLAAAGAVETGRWISEGLAEYLHLTTGRPPGALTPEEAREAIARATSDEELAHRAARLVERCDHARFAGAGSSVDELVAEARGFWNGFRQRGRNGRWRG